jgi:hypothetical protein
MPDLYPEVEPDAQGILEITAVISSTGRCAAIPGATLPSSYTVVPARGVSRGIGGCSILLRTALSCSINVVVGGVGLMRATLRQTCRKTPLEI